MLSGYQGAVLSPIGKYIVTIWQVVFHSLRVEKRGAIIIRNHMMRRIIISTAGLVALVGAGVVGYLALGQSDADQFAECRASSTSSRGVSIGGAFELMDHTGKMVTDVDVIDKPTLMYFGYTFCPDVCPFDTYRNAEAVALLDERGYDVKPVMVSIDPGRDTPEVMGAFVTYLHEDMVGLTGTSEQTASAIKAYRVYAAKNGDDPENYLMDHSTSTYLMAPDYGFLGFFGRDDTPESMADRVACFVDKL